VAKGGLNDGPGALHGRREALVIYRNLPLILAAGLGGASTAAERPDDADPNIALALEIDQAMRERAPAGWKGDPPREAQVLNVLFPLMGRNRGSTQALFELLKNQVGYQ
jgi:type I restriction enzyme R subunit